MRWERVILNPRSKDCDGKKSPGRIGGIFGPGRRWGHTCNSIKGGRYLYVFGGYGKDNCQTNDVHVFDTIKQTWSKPMVKGALPSPRDSHSCTTVGNNLFVFGGTDGKNPLKDLFILDTTTNSWMLPNLIGEGPDPREGHSAALIGKRLFIFGGCGKSQDDPQEVYYNDLYILDTESLHWQRATTSGPAPSARDSHTCSAWKNKLIVLGGEDASDYYLSDVHILDADNLVWKELNTSGQMLAPRAGHSTVALGKNLFVFGGFTDDRNLYDDLHVLNVDTGIWHKVANAGQGPSARFSIAGDCLDPQKGILVFIGGCNETLEALDDMYYLYTDTSMQNGQGDQRQEKFSLRKELKKRRREQYIPSNISEKENDVTKLEIMSGSLQVNSSPIDGQPVIQKCSASLYELKASEEKIFEARVTDAFHYGYTIETLIEGKPLRGILFSYKPSFGHAAHAYLSRKSVAGESGAVKLNGADKPKSKTVKAVKQEVNILDQGHKDEVISKEFIVQEPCIEDPVSDSNNSAPVLEVSESYKPPGKLESSPVLPDPDHDMIKDEHKPITEAPCLDQLPEIEKADHRNNGEHKPET